MRFLMRILFLLTMIFIFLTGAYTYDGLMTYLNLDTYNGTATPVVRHYFDLFTINAYYMSLSVKDYFININWGVGHGLMFLAVFGYASFDVIKRLYVYRELRTDFGAVMKLPLVAIVYLMLSVFAPYRLTKIMDGAEIRYDYEYPLMKRLLSDELYGAFLKKSAVFRALVVSDLQASYLTDLLEIAYRKRSLKID